MAAAMPSCDAHPFFGAPLSAHLKAQAPTRVRDDFPPFRGNLGFRRKWGFACRPSSFFLLRHFSILTNNDGDDDASSCDMQPR